MVFHVCNHTKKSASVGAECQSLYRWCAKLYSKQKELGTRFGPFSEIRHSYCDLDVIRIDGLHCPEAREAGLRLWHSILLYFYHGIQDMVAFVVLYLELITSNTLIGSDVKARGNCLKLGRQILSHGKGEMYISGL